MTPVRCCFAGCRALGEFFEPDGQWSFCDPHYTIHLALRREEQREQRRAEGLREPKPRRDQRPCGTHAAYLRHKAHGEYPCPACAQAESTYQKARYARRRAS